MKKWLIVAVTAACVSMVACDQNSVLNLPRAKVGAKCSSPGAFARDNANVLQCSKKKRWAVNMPIVRAIAMIDAYNRAELAKRAPATTVASPPPPTTTPVTTPPTTTPPPDPYPMAVSSGGDATCWTLSNGRTYCSGRNDHGQLGIGTISPTGGGYVVLPAGMGLSSVKLGEDHACGMVNESLNTPPKVWCWGRNDHGQVGDGTTIDRSVPTKVLGAVTPQTIAVGSDHSCATPNDAAIRLVWCWGANDRGQLGTGTIGGQSTTPVTISWPTFEPPAYIQAGDGFSCAMAMSKVFCWGRNDRGQLGDLSTTNRPAPVEVLGVTTSWPLAVGRAHVCVAGGTTTITCWGDNTHGQFGDGSTDGTPNPGARIISPAVTNGQFLYLVTAGGDRTCLLHPAVACAGDNEFGQVDPSDSDLDVTTFQIPDVMPYANSSAHFLLGMGDAHTCSIYVPPAWTGQPNDGACWGDDSYGQITG